MALKKPVVEKTSLLEWVKEHHSDEEMREVFLNMDIALKYIHDHGYCIEVFYPTHIEILNNKPDHIQFDNLLELSKNPMTSKEMIQEDIFNSSLIQIGLYTNTINSLTPDFLRDNFDELTRFVPEGDVPYYRGVVQRGASVYFCEYAVERMHRDLEALDKEIAEAEGGKPLQKSNGHFGGNYYDDASLSNDQINDAIYKQINGLNDVAFVSYLLIPTIALVTLIIIAFISWVLSFL